MLIVAGAIMRAENLEESASKLRRFIITVVVGLTIHVVVMVPTLYYVITRKNPLDVIRGYNQALMTSLATSSRSVQHDTSAARHQQPERSRSP